MKNNGRVTIALIRKDISYLQKHQENLSKDIKDIKTILTDGSGKISALREGQKAIWRVFSIIGTVLGLAITIIIAIK